MVDLPRPLLFTSPADIEVLPSGSLASHLPPSSNPLCCYQFGLTTLPGDTKSSPSNDLHRNLSQLFNLSQLLAIPSLFGRGDGQAWTHSEQHYPALLQWREQHVPTLLSRISTLLQKLNDSYISDPATKNDSESLHIVLGHVVCAVARYVAPTCSGLASEPGPSSKTELEDGWLSKTSHKTAKDILAGLRQHSLSDNLPTTPEIAKALLVDYIKPIFREIASSSSSTSSINPDTGRKRPPAPGSAFIPHLDAHLGQHRFQSAADDNAASNLAPSRFALALDAESIQSAVADSIPGWTELASPSRMERNEALGCVNVLAWCLDNLQLNSESDWSSAWPLLVPPLLTLLEHPQPRFRLRGALLVHQLLLRPSSLRTDADAQERTAARRREIVLGRILFRTGIGSLLEQALHVNLTYVHDEQHAPALLSHSIGALRQLLLLTTYPITYVDPARYHSEDLSASADKTSPPAATGSGAEFALDQADDCGARRMDALFRLVSEGILSTWSYLPLPPSSTRLGRELVSVTCAAYTTLIDDLAPPGAETVGGVARFLDVTLDWIFRSWLSTVAFTNTDQIATTVTVLNLARKLLFPPSSPSHNPDSHEHEQPSSAKRFTSLILAAVAKGAISAFESPLRAQSTPASSGAAQSGWTQLDACIASLLRELWQTDASVKSRWAALVRLDPRLGSLSPARAPDTASFQIPSEHL